MWQKFVTKGDKYTYNIEQQNDDLPRIATFTKQIYKASRNGQKYKDK